MTAFAIFAHSCGSKRKFSFCSVKPPNLTFQQAAVVPTSAFAALQALRDRGAIRSGQEVLIFAATGGVRPLATAMNQADLHLVNELVEGRS